MKLYLRSVSLTGFILFAAALMAACNLPLTKSATQVPAPALTAAAGTVSVLRTQFAATLPLGSSTPGAQYTPTPTAAAPTSSGSCDRAGLIAETIPDNTPITRGTAFTKTWTFKNTGDCTWNSSYSLIFAKGDAMGANETQPLPFTSVAPGEIIQVSVDLVAPLAGDAAKGEWMLRNARGALFGLGPKGDQTFWVQIKLTN